MSLRARILLLVLAASMLPVLAVLWLLLENRVATGELAREQLMARAETLASELDDKIAGTAQLLFGLGRVPVVGGDDKAACSKFLADVLKEHPQYTGLLTIKPDGTLFCDSLRSGRHLKLNDRQYFQQALTSLGPVLEPVIGRLTGIGVLQIAYPVRAPDGALQYILLASLDMEAYGRSVAQTLPYTHMHFQIWNRDGSVIMDHPGPGASKTGVLPAQREFMLSPSLRQSETASIEASAEIWAKAALPRSPQAGLRLALSVPEADLNERIDGQFKKALTGLVVLAVLSFLGAGLLGEFAVRRQTARLMRSISRIDSGDYMPALLGTTYPRGELGQVMLALDRMAGSLDEQRQEIKRNTEALEHQAGTDALTNLANRHLLNDRLDQTLAYARRANRVAGVLMLDLDRFKTVNDSMGHRQGDRLLQEVARRISECVREIDTVARLGGDEFVIVLADLAMVEDIVLVAEKIIRSLARPVEIGQQILSTNASLGIAVFPQDGSTADELLQYADTAMYRAKELGGNGMAFFTPEMKQTIIERMQIEAGLRRALEHDELILHYQPIIDAQSGRVVSAEALIRWQDPQRGLISPLDFIPVAEETGLIIPIGNWVLHAACQQARAWQSLGLGPIPVAVNLSARQFSVPTLDEAVTHALQANDCPAALLQLEITESSIMNQIEQASATMHRLTALGVELAIDDFGTGYSSLSQLKRFPVSKLKIDRGFINDLPINANEDILVDAIITLANKLGLRSVAEGVETEAQVALLKKSGCTEYQGYLFSRPCTPDDFVAFVRKRNAGLGQA